MRSLKNLIQSLLPRSLYRSLLIPYHVGWSLYAAMRYGFPAKKLVVIGVTGTKGKSSVSEMIAATLEGAGKKVAVSSTIHFRVADVVRPNLFKMTLPGRGFIQKLMREAIDAGCTHMVIEVTSEAALQYRHLFLSMNALVFTNLEKEHIESHGSMEKYFQAKFRIGKQLVKSSKRPRAIVANEESDYGKRFLMLPVEKQIPFALSDVSELSLSSDGISYIFADTRITVPQPGNFSVLNSLATIKVCEFLGISVETSKKALEKISTIPGRVERIDEGQDFLAIVDYAHTPDSLRALYEAFADKRKICVLGNTGGGRDTWKRPEMGRIAGDACDVVILTNEDPYDEDPRAILDQMAEGVTSASAINGSAQNPHIIMDRREAIGFALSAAKPGDAVLITGKGTDPYIMEAHGAKTPWSDAQVVREELVKRKDQLVS